MPITITEKQRRAEEREFKKLSKIIAKKDKKALDKWTRDWLREERRDIKKLVKRQKDDWF